MRPFISSSSLAPALLAIFATGLSGCSSLKFEETRPGSTQRLETPFIHNQLEISGWETPPTRGQHLLPQATLFVRRLDQCEVNAVRLKVGRSSHGLRLAQVDLRPETYGSAETGYAAVITTYVCLELQPPTPHRYLFLSDSGSDPIASYSDTPLPSVQ
jgi:hypothetical protein